MIERELPLANHVYRVTYTSYSLIPSLVVMYRAFAGYGEEHAHDL